ncbi:MAG: hypothetical protein ACO3JL_21140, partial [Myxococcota bacterium]
MIEEAPWTSGLHRLRDQLQSHIAELEQAQSRFFGELQRANAATQEALGELAKCLLPNLEAPW